MDPNRILPDLQCALLCEQVRREANGNFFIIGIVDSLKLQKLPATILQLCVFTRWTAGFGEFVETIRLIAPDKATEMSRCEVKFALNAGHESASNMAVLRNIQLTQVGVYYVEVSVEDVMKIRVPLPVGALQPAPGASTDAEDEKDKPRQVG